MIAGIPFIISIIITLILMLISKKKLEYVNEVSKLNKEQYPFKDIMTIGLLLEDKIGIDKFKKQNKALYEKMISMYGMEIEEHFRLHIANKIMLAIIDRKSIV